MVKQQLQPNGNSLSKGKPPIFVVLSIKKYEEVERRNTYIKVDLFWEGTGMVIFCRRELRFPTLADC